MPKNQSQDRKERKKWKSSHTEEENHLVGLDLSMRAKWAATKVARKGKIELDG